MNNRAAGSNPVKSEATYLLGGTLTAWRQLLHLTSEAGFQGPGGGMQVSNTFCAKLGYPHPTSGWMWSGIGQT